MLLYLLYASLGDRRALFVFGLLQLKIPVLI